MDNVREGIRAYERYLIGTILFSFLTLALTITQPESRRGSVVVINGVAVPGWLAFLVALGLYLFFSLAGRYFLVRAVENVRLIPSRETRRALRHIPSIATDHRSSFRFLMLMVAPVFVVLAMIREALHAGGDIGDNWLGYLIFAAIVGLITYAVWQQLKLLELEITKYDSAQAPDGEAAIGR